jgi:branched-chain amino acid transport system substrate-binding protein
MRSVRRPPVAELIIAGLLLSSCTIGMNPTRHEVGVVKLGVDLPLTGDDAADGTPVRNAIDLAIKQAGLVCGASAHQDACVRLQTVVTDDVTKGIHDPATGANNVEGLATDPGVVAMVGPLYDSLARSELPVAKASHLAMVSPAATDECLTQQPSDGHCNPPAGRPRPAGPNSFFRVVATELAQGPAAADLAFKTLGKRTTYIVNDQTALGHALATSFMAQFVRDGGTVVDPSDLGGFDPNHAPDFTARVERARQLGADVVYFAGSQIDAAALLRRQMAGALQAPLIGNDRLASDQFAKSTGANVRGSYYTVVGPVASKIAQAQGFLRDYRRAYGQEVGTYSVQAFDATNILIAAIARAIDDAGGKSPTREQVLNEVAATSDYHGAMGVTSFDSRGDTTLKLLGAYEWLASTDPTGRFVAQIALN